MKLRIKGQKVRLNKLIIAHFCRDKVIYPNFSLKDVQSILIHPLGDAVGDAIICTAYARQLRQMYPTARIGIFATVRNWEILSHCPAIDELVMDKASNWYKQRQKWDLLIDFYEYFHSNDLIMNKILAPKLVMVFKKKPKEYYNLNNIRNYDFYSPYSVNAHVSRHLNTSVLNQYFDVEEPEPFVEFSSDEKNVGHRLWQQLAPNKIRIFVAPQGSIYYKSVSPKDIAKLLNSCEKAHRKQVSFVLCYTQSASDYFAELKQLCDEDIDIQLSPSTTLQQYIALTATADIVIGVDSGTSHLAGALKRPFLGFYVKHNIKTWAPLMDKNVPNLLLVANTDAKDLTHEGYAWKERHSFHISQGSAWLNRQIYRQFNAVEKNV